MAKARADHVVNRPFARTDRATGLDTRYEVGDPYDGPDVGPYTEQGLIVPASAGQPGSDEEGKSE